MVLLCKSRVPTNKKGLALLVLTNLTQIGSPKALILLVGQASSTTCFRDRRNTKWSQQIAVPLYGCAP